MDAQLSSLPKEDFIYEPLPGPEHIRVLSVSRTKTFDDPIECDLEAVPLNSSADYVALSYSWGKNAGGDATPNRAVSIHGKTKHITQNLFEGLLRLRQNAVSPKYRKMLDLQDTSAKRKPPRLWVDAICINQDNDRERTQQVSQMRHVYENANGTFIWLGEAVDEADDSIVLRVFQCLGKGNYAALPTKETPNFLQRLTCDLKTTSLVNNNEGTENLARQVALKASSLLRRRYFTRLLCRNCTILIPRLFELSGAGTAAR